MHIISGSVFGRILPAPTLLRVLALTLLLVSNGGFAQSLILDTNFNPKITRLTSRGQKVHVQSDGKILVAGDFVELAGSVRHRLARLHVNGSVDSTFDPGTRVQGGMIVDFARQSDGKIIIVGHFTHTDDTQRPFLARLNADATLDASFDPGTGPNGPVLGVLLQTDGKIVIDGEFTAVNGTARAKMARLNSNGSLDTSFDPGTGIAGSSPFLSEMVLQSDGKIVVGGKFTSFNGQSRGGIVRLNSDGSVDPNFALSGGVSQGFATVNAVALQPDGKILIGGGFNRVNNVNRTNVARLNSTGSLDTSFAPPAPDFRVFSLALQSDGKVLIGGEFNAVGGITRTAIARLSSLGAVDPGFDPGTAGRHSTFSIALQSDGKIVLGNYANTTNHIAFERLTSTGQPDATFNAAPILNAPVIHSSVLQPDGKVIIAGDFDYVNGTARRRLARINSNGTLDTSFDAGAGPSGSLQFIQTMALQSDGKVVVGGGFTTVNCIGRNRIARVNSDGSLDTGFDPGTGANSRVHTVSLQGDGKIIVGGSFTTFNSASKPNLVRLTTTGAVDGTFTTGTGPTAQVYTTAVQPDGKILIGGSFSQYNGTSRGGRARLLPSGVLDTTFVPVGVAIAELRASLVQPDGNILFGGYFYYTTGDTNWTTVQRLNPSGALISNVGTGPEISEMVYSLGALKDGSPIFGGGVAVQNLPSPTRFGRLLPNGQIDHSFTPSLPVPGPVLTIATSSDGRVICGGDFSRIYGANRFGLARLLDMRPLTRSIQNSAGQIQFAVSGEMGSNYRVETSPDLVQWNTFSNFTATASETLIQDTTSAPQKFYRAVWQP